jgi:hypothetical protein
MNRSIHSSTERERDLASLLRTICIGEIQNRDPLQVCESLGLESSGLMRLLWKPRWDLQTAFRVSDALGLRVVDELLSSEDLTSNRQERHAS